MLERAARDLTLVLVALNSLASTRSRFSTLPFFFLFPLYFAMRSGVMENGVILFASSLPVLSLADCPMNYSMGGVHWNLLAATMTMT